MNGLRFKVPVAGKMINTSLKNRDTACCFVINKGYIESDTLADMLDVLDSIMDDKDYIFVGSLSKVRLKGSGSIVYRQRLFFKSLLKLMELCKQEQMDFIITEDFTIGISGVLNCISEIPYFGKYALKHGETVEDWLTNCCKIHIYNLMYELNLPVRSDFQADMDKILADKRQYIWRSPFLLKYYDPATKTSTLYLERYMLDGRADNDKVFQTSEGYTKNNVKKDIKKGVFK